MAHFRGWIEVEDLGDDKVMLIGKLPEQQKVQDW